MLASGTSWKFGKKIVWIKWIIGEERRNKLVVSISRLKFTFLYHTCFVYSPIRILVIMLLRQFYCRITAIILRFQHTYGPPLIEVVRW